MSKRAGTRPFWRTKTLSQMSSQEWESLCDGCGQCCLHKLAVPDGPALKTDVACRLLNTDSCRCTNYTYRKKLVHDCVTLTPENVPTLRWLPRTCAYRLIAEGQDLPSWHPLVSGDPESVHAAGISVRGKCISERDAGPLDAHIIL